MEYKFLKRLTVETLLENAEQQRAIGNYAEAVRISKDALHLAETIAGEVSLLAILVLVELFDLYDEQGKTEEAEKSWQHIRSILKSVVHCDRSCS